MRRRSGPGSGTCCPSCCGSSAWRPEWSRPSATTPRWPMPRWPMPCWPMRGRSAGPWSTTPTGTGPTACRWCRSPSPTWPGSWPRPAAEGYPARGIWQSTTGTAPFLIVNGPVREQIGMNSRGNVFGSGFRANATIGRAIRLTAINAFGLRPHQLDQATQGTPAKYTACIAENEEESPWPPLHADFGLDPSDSAVTAMVIRSCVHIEARHTTVPEQLAADIAGTISRTGALIHETVSALLVLSPEHARLFGRAGWSKPDLSQFIYDHAVRSRAELAAVGKDAIARQTRWRLPTDHPDAM